ncbi:MAG TPA: methionine adenosyltransferase [Acidobacteriota bacterium]|nr:methionine adenosyltransferase [Acidobacteriota bacterium]
MQIVVEQLSGVSTADQRIEVVERKGLGHPDSICDAVMEEAARALSREYRSMFGTILHHNLDKALLVGGAAERKFGGGRITEPMRLIFGDRATLEAQGRKIPVEEIVVETAKAWFRRNLRFVDPEKNVSYQMEIRPGSSELSNIFAGKKRWLGANDTSAGVGFAPLTETEAIVLETELHLNSHEFKEQHPETGEDVKIMAIRRDRDLQLTVAMPLIDRFIADEQAYFEIKRAALRAIREIVRSRADAFANIKISLNTADEKGKGLAGIYLTVTGTSAEHADSGEVGRGNRVHGLISFNRPTSLEAAAGKNAVSHIGKIYNLLAHKMAHKIYEEIPGMKDVTILLVSEIGVPINRPALAAAKILMQQRKKFAPVANKIRSTIRHELQHLPEFIEDVLAGKYPVT